MRVLLAGTALAALAAPHAALAQKHMDHDMPGMDMPVAAPAAAPAPNPMPAPAPAQPPAPAPAAAEHAPAHTLPMATQDMQKMDGMDGMAGMGAMSGQGSGTSRLPSNEAMGDGIHIGLGTDTSLMLHGYLWPIYTHQSGPRGDDKLFVQSMAMATVTHDFGGARLMGRTLLSLEPAMRHDGYPLLFATGEEAYGRPLVDRQHPHDLVMELAARLDVDIAPGTTVFLYGGPVGEPALGPSAFMHRASAQYNPEAPITHHWFDSTHITYGVVTAGLSTPRWQIEASAFRGREPDEFRWNIETPKLDSWSVRASFAPSAAWLLQASYGELHAPEPMHPGQDEHRFTASASFNNGHGLSAMAAFSAKQAVPGDTHTAWLGEVNWDITRHHTVFGRIENVANGELFPDHADPLHDQVFRVTKFQAGYAYRMKLAGPLNLALGGSVAAFAKPGTLDAVYGDAPTGYTVFAKLSLGG